MNETRYEKIYETIYQMVIWDEKKETVFQKLNASGVYNDEAQAMYDKAMKERISAIRKDHWIKLIKGLPWMAAAAILFFSFWEGAGGITPKLLGLCAVGMAYGLWKSSDGLVGILMAKHKRGSLADME